MSCTSMIKSYLTSEDGVLFSFFIRGSGPAANEKPSFPRAFDGGGGTPATAAGTAALLQFTVMATGSEGIPFATTTSELAPVSIPAGTSKLVKTMVEPVA